MANTSAKKIKKQNEIMLRRALYMIIGFAVVFIGVRFFWWYDSTTKGHWIGLFCIIATNAAGYLLLKISATPTLSPTGDILDPGADLKSPGLMSYYWDMLYISWFVQITTLISDWFWLTMLVIPLFGGYIIWTQIISPYMSMMSQKNNDDPRALKKLKKMEKKAMKTKFVRR